MEKVELQSKDITKENIKEIKKLFLDCVTETKIVSESERERERERERVTIYQI